MSTSNRTYIHETQQGAQKSDEAFRALETYFMHSNSEIKTMNKFRYHSKKCVMTLQSANSSTGSAAWFIKLWRQLSIRQKIEFRSNIEQTQRFEKGDFQVSVRETNECPVVFYLLQTLEPLILRTFTAHQRPSVNQYPIMDSVWQQAFRVLHNPSFGNNEYRNFICLAYDEYIDFGDPLLRMPLNASTKLCELSGLLTQLQHLNNSDLRLLHESPEQIQYREERTMGSY